MVARRLQPGHHPQIHVGLLVVAWKNLAPPYPSAEGGALLHFETITGEMFRLEGDGFLHRVLPAGHVLAGQAVHEVQAQISDLGRPDGRHRVLHLLERVGAVEGGELVVVGGLHPQGDPVDARAA